jgi:hypothetical protein
MYTYIYIPIYISTLYIITIFNNIFQSLLLSDPILRIDGLSEDEKQFTREYGNECARKNISIKKDELCAAYEVYV